MISFENQWKEIYPNYEWLLKEFRDAIGAGEMEFSLCTVRNLTKIKEYLLDGKAANTVVTYCAILKAFLGQFADTDLLPCGNKYKDALKVKKNPSEHITLNEGEIALIEAYEPKEGSVGDVEREIKAQFLCEYYSLARSSDIKRFTEENIDLERGVITYVAQKTKKSAIVPLHRNFMKYFQERGEEHNRAHYNYVIKKICRKVGITQEVKVFYHGKETTMPKYKLVGSHTARRSGATNLAKRGVPVPVIAKMMSHGQDFQMTQRYIWIDDIQLDEAGSAFFK